MSHAIAPEELRPNQVVSLRRNGVALRWRVLVACRRLILEHVTAARPVTNAREFLAAAAPYEPVNDSGRIAAGKHQRAASLLLELPRERVGELGQLELVCDPRWN
jgi:hypothetical protein